METTKLSTLTDQELYQLSSELQNPALVKGNSILKTTIKSLYGTDTDIKKQTYEIAIMLTKEFSLRLKRKNENRTL